MAAASSKSLHSLIWRHLLRPSAAAATSKTLLPSASTQSLNLFLLKSGGIKSNPYLPQWRPLSSSLMQIGAARTYATKVDRDYAVTDGGEGSDDDDDDDIFDNDDMENYSGSDFDDEDDYEDPDEDPDAK